MKTNTSKRCRIIGTGLLVAGLLFSCQMAGDSGSHSELVPNIIEPGKGAITVTLETSEEIDARTIKPMFDFQHVMIQLAPYQATPFGPVTDRFSGTSKTISVFPGEYKLDAYLYAEASDMLPIAKGSAEKILIEAGKPTVTSVTLKPVELTADYTGSGKFKYLLPDADLMSTIANAGITITKGNTTVQTIDLLKPQNDDGIQLPVGYYTAIAEFKNIYGASTKALETLWVYKGLSSTFDLSWITGAHFNGNPGTATVTCRLDTGCAPMFLTDINEVAPETIIGFEIENRNYKQISFYVDGTLTQTGVSAFYTLRAAGLTAGSHEMSVVTYDQDNIPRSASIRFIVKMGQQPVGYDVHDEATLKTALREIATSNESDVVINITAEFCTDPVNFGPELSGKSIQFTTSGQKTIGLKSQGVLFTVQKNIFIQIDKGITLQGIGENNSPLIKVFGGKLIVKGILNNNACYLLKNRNNPLAIAGIYAEDAKITLDGGIIEEMYAEHWFPYETYMGGNITAVGAIYAKNSVVDLKNGAIIQGAEGYIMDDPSYAAGGIFLNGSIAIIDHGTIMNCKAGSYNFNSYAAASVFVSEDSTLTLNEGCLITKNETHVTDLYNNAAGTLLVNGKLEIRGGDIKQNILKFGHRYTFSYTYGSAGVYLGQQSIFLKTGGLIFGTDSPYANKYISDDTQARGTIRVGAAAYYAVDGKTVDNSF